MINKTQLSYDLWVWLTNVTGIKWISANQNVDVPLDPFGTIFLSGIDKFAEDVNRYEYNTILDNLTEYVEGARILNVSLNIFGAGANDFMAAIVASTHQTAHNTQLMNAGLAFINSSQIRDLTEVISSKFNERAQMDCQFYIESSYNLDIDRVAETNISGKFDDRIVNINVINT